MSEIIIYHTPNGGSVCYRGPGGLEGIDGIVQKCCPNCLTRKELLQSLQGEENLYAAQCYIPDQRRKAPPGFENVSAVCLLHLPSGGNKGERSRWENIARIFGKFVPGLLAMMEAEFKATPWGGVLTRQNGACYEHGVVDPHNCAVLSNLCGKD